MWHTQLNMKTFLAYWLVVQLLLVGIAGGVMWRELVDNGCIVDKEIDRSLEFFDWWAPIAIPLMFLTGDVSEHYCKDNK